MSLPSNIEERHSRFELRTLLETSRLLIESQDPDFVLNNLLLITMGKLMVTRGMVLLYKPGESTYFISKAKGKGWQREGENIHIEIGTALQETSILHGDKHPTLFKQLGIQTECTLFNLKTSNYHIGFICLGPKANGKVLTTRELEFIESLAIISSVALSNSRLFQELRHINRRLDRKVHDLNTLLQLSKDFNLMVDRDEIARVFKFAMLGQMLIRTFFFALDVDGEKSIISISGMKEEPSKEDLNHLFELDDIVHVQKDESCDFLHNNDIQLLIGLRFQNDKIGVVGVGASANIMEYGDSEVNFLQSLGNLALLTIQKTLLLEERLAMQRLEEELSLAKTIQKGFLPEPLPTLPGFDLAAINVSSRQVGGDYFDFITTPDGGHLVAIADVTGKGVPASLLMANLQSMLHALAPIEISLSEATASINDIIHKNTPSDKFITFFWGKISKDGDSFKYVNAGHNPPILLRKDSDKPILLEEGGLILGAMPTLQPYEAAEIELKSGDIITFFTDGVTEAFNKNQTEEYEEWRLLECIRKNRNLSSQQIIDAIITDINVFSHNTQHDDITMIVLKVN